MKQDVGGAEADYETINVQCTWIRHAVNLGPNLQNIARQIYKNVMTYDRFMTDLR